MFIIFLKFILFLIISYFVVTLTLLCISMVIAKTASRNVAFKTDVMSQAVLEAQASFVIPEVTDQEASSERCSLDDGDVERNADLYAFNHEVAHG